VTEVSQLSRAVYSVGDLVKRTGAFTDTDLQDVGIVIDVVETIGKLSFQIPYSYVVKWSDDTTSEYGVTAIQPVVRE
jgi:hypothetical protein